MDEWTRNLIKNKPEKEESVLSQKRVIKAHFEEAFVTGYKPLIEGLELPDHDDRHVLAAAIKMLGSSDRNRKPPGFSRRVSG